MPLSEHEQRLLEEMERSLYHNDADFVATVGGRRGKPAYRSIVLGILITVVGVACLVVGVLVQVALVGILGFVIMLTGVLFAIAPPRHRAGQPEESAQSKTTAGKSRENQGFMDKLNERWDKRQDGSS
ncbi:MAG: DUF3040 domain-containing protein [Microbacteriaceae bacterium]|nr:MAG: DUF3040 domain-containing protein [Microbacteriaceae bacterium]